ncbi:unnamed protein product [Parnassius mnemosyne]|uniref:Uncharacterized protein n=1 Tax=Parnassius mnemosyne TaxID=213953 RepID=A0AAV1KA92_9NEOP
MACQPKRSETVVIHELLAFVQQKLDVMDQVSLEQILMTSFTEDEIIQAKKVLADSAVTQIRLITRHRDGRGALKSNGENKRIGNGVFQMKLLTRVGTVAYTYFEYKTLEENACVPVYKSFVVTVMNGLQH